MSTNSPILTQYIKNEQVAKKLQVHWQTVLDLIRSGLLPAVKVGKQYRIDPSHLQNFISAHETSGMYQAKELFEYRAKQFIDSPSFLNSRLLIVGYSCPPSSVVDSLLAGLNSPVSKVLRSNQDNIRPYGWHFDPALNQIPKPAIDGEFLELTDKVRSIRVYKDGAVIGVGLLTDYLGLRMDRAEESDENDINGLAVCEFIANFFIKVSKIMKFINPVPSKALLSLMLFNPKANRLTLKYSGGSIWGPQKLGDRFQQKELRTYTETSFSDKNGVLKAAADVWCMFGHIFGMLDDSLPLIKSELIDIEVIKSIKF